MASAFQDSWEKYFTVAQWDQRGAGKTFESNSREPQRQTMNVPQMEQDAVDVANYLRTRFKRASRDFWPLAFSTSGFCVWKSRFLPRFLGLLIAACFGYLAVSLTPFLLPSYANIVSRFANIRLTLGEPAAILWLLIMGAKDQPLEAAPGVGVDVRRIPT